MAAVITGVTVVSNYLNIVGISFSVGNQDNLVQMLTTTPSGKILGDVTHHVSGALTSSGTHYEGAGTYIVNAYEFGLFQPTSTILATWTGTL